MTPTEENQTLLNNSFSPGSSRSRSPYGSVDSTEDDAAAHASEHNTTEVNYTDGSASSGRPSSLVECDAHDRRTLYERKCELIDQEIQNLGMGKYQWYIWSLCGLGYMIDLLWAQAFGLVLSPMQQELGFGNEETGRLSTAFSAGLTAGALVWGVLVDIIGRRWAFNLTVLISSVFGLCLGFPDSYTSILFLTACVGFGVGGNIPIDTTITLEFTPQKHRYLLPLLSVFQPVGVIICSVMAYGFIPNASCSPNFSEPDPLPACRAVPSGQPCCSKTDNMGWRYLLYTLGFITLFVFFARFVVFRFQESPKFLIYRGRDAEAVKVLRHVAKMNQRPCNLTMDNLEEVENEWSILKSKQVKSMPGDGAMGLQKTSKDKLLAEIARFKLLFSDLYMIRVTLLIWVIYICDFSGFTIAGFYLPQILALKNGALNLNLRYTYRSYILIYTPGIFGVLFGALLYRVPYLRRSVMVLSSLLMSLSIFAFSTINTAPSNIALNATEYLFQSMFNAVLYGWTPEAFPAPIRGTACGLASFWGRAFGIASPLVAQRLYAGSGGDGGKNGRDANAVLFLAGGITLGCVLATALLPARALRGMAM